MFMYACVCNHIHTHTAPLLAGLDQLLFQDADGTLTGLFCEDCLAVAFSKVACDVPVHIVACSKLEGSSCESKV